MHLSIYLFIFVHTAEGRNPVSSRLLSHFNVISVMSFDDENLISIYNEMLNIFMAHFHTVAREFSSTVVHATIELYRTLCNELLPTPIKSHYTFNLRDLSKVFQGVLTVSPDCILSSIPSYHSIIAFHSIHLVSFHFLNS